MAAELLALVNGYDAAYTVQHLLEEILNRKIPLGALYDSKTTFNCVANSSGTLEKRLQIDAATLRQSLVTGELQSAGWIPGNQNPADGLTRDEVLKNDHPLIRIMMTNKVTWKESGWVTISK